MQLFISELADQDIDRHFSYIAENNLDAAVKLYDAMFKSFDLLQSSPKIGVKCQFSHPKLVELRQWHVKGFKKYLIFYREGFGSIEIVRVLHSSRDLEQALIEDH